MKQWTRWWIGILLVGSLLGFVGSRPALAAEGKWANVNRITFLGEHKSFNSGVTALPVGVPVTVAAELTYSGDWEAIKQSVVTFENVGAGLTIGYDQQLFFDPTEKKAWLQFTVTLTEPLPIGVNRQFTIKVSDGVNDRYVLTPYSQRQTIIQAPTKPVEPEEPVVPPTSSEPEPEIPPRGTDDEWIEEPEEPEESEESSEPEEPVKPVEPESEEPAVPGTTETETESTTDVTETPEEPDSQTPTTDETEPTDSTTTESSETPQDSDVPTSSEDSSTSQTSETDTTVAGDSSTPSTSTTDRTKNSGNPTEHTTATRSANKMKADKRSLPATGEKLSHGVSLLGGVLFLVGGTILWRRGR